VPDSSVNIVTRRGGERPGFDNWQGQLFSLFLTPPPIQWVPGSLALGVLDLKITSVMYRG